MKVLVVSTMFPNRAQPVHAVFVRNRVSRVAERCDVRVLSPIPWFPFGGLLKRYRHRRSIPRRDEFEGLRAEYPRFLSIPAILKPLDGVFLFLSVWWAARRIRKEFDFDLIDAHLAYPDGYGCALLAKLLGKPLDHVRSAVADTVEAGLPEAFLRLRPPARPRLRIHHGRDDARLDLLLRQRIANVIDDLLDKTDGILGRESTQLVAAPVKQLAKRAPGQYIENRIDGLDGDAMVLLLGEIDAYLTEERVDRKHLADPPPGLVIHHGTGLKTHQTIES